MRYAAAVFAGLTAAAAPSCAADELCPFTYSNTIKTEIVEPIVLHMAKGGHPFFDVDRPTISIVRGKDEIFYDWNQPLPAKKGGIVQILVGPFKTTDGGVLIDAPPIGISIDPCTNKMIDSYWVSPFPSDAPAH